MVNPFHRLLRLPCRHVTTRQVDTSRNSSSYNRLHISSEVQQAIANGEPVVALESTIVAHGMPYPQNLEVAQVVENLLRERGVMPATIAIQEGIAHIGLSPDELKELAETGSRAQKISTRELSLLMARRGAGSPKQWGATTVASTMRLAHLAQIPTFVTGGIGGVHRDGEISMDVSADLTELSRTPVIVVSAGIKSILDIPRTLEVLETLAVPTVTFGADDFPAFFSPTSGTKSPWRIDSASEISQAYQAARDLDLPHGMLVAVPNPNAAGKVVEHSIQDALKQASEKGISGQALTPFILKTVAEQSDGESLRSNISLVKNNAIVGAEIAIAIANGRSSSATVVSGPYNESSCKISRQHGSQQEKQSKVTVFGGAVVDIVAKPSLPLLMGTSNPGTSLQADGGVARNVAEAMARLGCRPKLYTAVGENDYGLMQRFRNVGGIDCSITLTEKQTASYIALLNEDGDLCAAVADMDILQQVSAPPRGTLQGIEFLIMDANPSAQVLDGIASDAHAVGAKVCLDPTSVPHARKVAADLQLMSKLHYAFPNEGELQAMAEVLSSDKEPHVEEMGLKGQVNLVLTHMNREKACLVITRGSDGVLLASKKKTSQGSDFFQTLFPCEEEIEVLNATGAGDSLCGAFCAALSRGLSHDDAVRWGMKAAELSLKTPDRAVSTKINTIVSTS